jgi:hypothetical protein
VCCDTSLTGLVSFTRSNTKQNQAKKATVDKNVPLAYYGKDEIPDSKINRLKCGQKKERHVVQQMTSQKCLMGNATGF